jgi:hypothetical protein
MYLVEILTQSSSLQTLRLCNTTENDLLQGFILTLATTEKKDRESFECAMRERGKARISRDCMGTDIRSRRTIKQEFFIETLLPLLLLAVLTVD